MFFAKKALFCDPKILVKKRNDAFYTTCVPTVLTSWCRRMDFHTGPVPLDAHLGVGETPSSPLFTKQTERELGRSHETNESGCGATAEEVQPIADSKFGNEKSKICSLADG